MSKLEILSLVGILIFKFFFQSLVTAPKNLFRQVETKLFIFDTATGKLFRIPDNGPKNLYKQNS